MYIFWHSVILFKMHCGLLKQKPMKLYTFISQIADTLIDYQVKVGQPSSIFPPPAFKPTKAKNKCPNKHVRKDKTILPLIPNHIQFCFFLLRKYWGGGVCLENIMNILDPKLKRMRLSLFHSV